jgi:hypothetical protein
MLPLRRIMETEIRRLGATAVRFDDGGGSRCARMIAIFGDGDELVLTVPRGPHRDRGHARQNQIARCRREVRALQRRRSA